MGGERAGRGPLTSPVVGHKVPPRPFFRWERTKGEGVGATSVNCDLNIPRGAQLQRVSAMHWQSPPVGETGAVHMYVCTCARALTGLGRLEMHSYGMRCGFSPVRRHPPWSEPPHDSQRRPYRVGPWAPRPGPPDARGPRMVGCGAGKGPHGVTWCTHARGVDTKGPCGWPPGRCAARYCYPPWWLPPWQRAGWGGARSTP